MVRQICYIAYRGNGFPVSDVYLKFNAVLVVHPHRRKPCLASRQPLVIQSIVAHKAQDAGSVSHQVYHADIFPYDLGLETMLLVRLARIVHFPKVFLVEDYFHVSAFAWQKYGIIPIFAKKANALFQLRVES